MTDHSLRPALWMLAGALAFATMGALTHALGPRCDWLVVALVRAVFMFSCTALLAWAAGVRLAFLDPPTLWMRSLAGSFSLVCNFFAMTRLPIADALTLTNVYPLWIILMSGLILRQVPSVLEVLGVGSGLVGIVLIERPHLAGDRFAALVALVGSVSSAVAMFGLHRLRGVDTRAVVAHFAGVASLVAGGWLALRRDAITPGLLEPATLLMLLGVGVTGTLGQVFITKAYAAGPPARVSVIGLTQVVFAMIYDVALWHRTMTPSALAGFGLVLAPTAWLTTRAGQALAAQERHADAPPRPDRPIGDQPRGPDAPPTPLRPGPDRLAP